MSASLRELYVEPLPRDALTLAQCMAIDAGVFPFPSRLFERAAFDGAVRVWLARPAPGERPVGVLASYLSGGELYVHGVAVERPHRRHGVGRALMRTAIDAAPSLGARAIVLQVSTTNAAAIALYKSEGFVARRRRPAYYAFGIYPGSGDAIEMARTIRSARAR